MKMSFLNIFGTKKKEITTSPLEVIQNMKNTLNTLEKREAFLEKRVSTFKTEARKFVKTNKPKTLSLLKKAKMNEKQLTSIYGQKNNLEMQVYALEQGINNQYTIKSLRQGKNALEKMTKTLDPDDIGELMDDIAANVGEADEIATVMSAPIGTVYDDDDLLAEFEEEEKHNTSISTDQELLDEFEKTNLKLPTVPTTEIIVKTDEEKELEELEKMMAL